jgi:hypothetical protein
MHPSIERAYEQLADRDEQEREHDAWLDRHAVELENQECDELLARLAERRQTPSSSNPGELLVYKDFSGALPEPSPPQPFSRLQIKSIGRALGMLRAEITKQTNDDTSGLAARIATLEIAVEALSERIAELESPDGYAG